MKNKADKIFVSVASALTTVALWFAIFHAAGQVRVDMLIDVFFMGVAIPLQLFVSKKRREGNEINSKVFRRGRVNGSLPLERRLEPYFGGWPSDSSRIEVGQHSAAAEEA